MKSTFLLNWIIVLATVLTVVGPMVASQYSDEIARWHLAAAANAAELGIGDRDESMRKAKDLSADIFGLRDYWLLLLQQTLDDNPANLPELVRFARTKDPNLARLGALAVRALEAEGEYELAVKVLEESLSEEARGLRTNLNFLAYMRSLAGVELDKARKDINQALKYSPNDPALRDTRAWILFKLGQYEDALEDADFAVKATEQQRLSNPFRFLESWGAESMQIMEGSPASDLAVPETAVPDSGSSAQTEGSPTPQNSPPSGTVSIQEYQEGVIRYHRGRILEKLGREKEMEQDWDWLRQHNLPIDDSLH